MVAFLGFTDEFRPLVYVGEEVLELGFQDGPAVLEMLSESRMAPKLIKIHASLELETVMVRIEGAVVEVP